MLHWYGKKPKAESETKKKTSMAGWLGTTKM
jgi:hypothetical protein